MNSTADAVCRAAYKETRNFYAKKEQCLGDAANGFDILHGPPIVNAPILFLGYQPGGTLRTARDGQHDSWPGKCLYESANWLLAKRLRRIWDPERLGNCTGLNAIFFRARSEKDWRRVPEGLRGEIEGFCRILAERIVRALEPQCIVVIGMKTFHMLTAGGIALTKTNGGGPLLKRGELWGARAFGVVHLSGARVSVGDLEQLATFFTELPAVRHCPEFR